ncbi:MAG: serine/threonine protein kinase [Labilithrix sp.]|nr:serine/threonine protein kinase [Labilithrix sp.]
MGPGHDDLVGRTLGGRYRVARMLGHGGMGVVYEAEQLDLRRSVALKVLQEVDPRSVQRFQQEALATANLRCPNVVTVLDFFAGSTDEPPYLVMELLEGEVLAAALRRTRQLPIERAIAIAAQMLVGLGAAHAAGIIHRDVKPANTFLVRTPVGHDFVKLLDFGIAKLVRGAIAKTTTGSVQGTPAYMAPEQLRDGETDARSDIHAVGACLFEMIAGRRPWRSPGGAELAAEILRDEPLDLAVVSPGVPVDLARVVGRALAKDRATRFPSAEAMLDALRPWLVHGLKPADVVLPTTRREHVHAHAPITALPSPASEKPDTMLRSVLVTLVAILLGVVAITAWPRAKPKNVDPDLAPIGLPQAAGSVAPAPGPSRMPSPAFAELAEPAAPSAAPESDDCYCVFTGKLPGKDGKDCRSTLCSHKNEPRCVCDRSRYSIGLASTFCSVPPEKGRCPPGKDGPIPIADAHPRDECTFYEIHRGRADALKGLVKCDYCYAPESSRAPPDQICSGFDAAGRVHMGRWECGTHPKGEPCYFSDDRFGR